MRGKLTAEPRQTAAQRSGERDRQIGVIAQGIQQAPQSLPQDLPYVILRANLCGVAAAGRQNALQVRVGYRKHVGLWPEGTALALYHDPVGGLAAALGGEENDRLWIARITPEEIIVACVDKELGQQLGFPIRLIGGERAAVTESDFLQPVPHTDEERWCPWQ